MGKLLLRLYSELLQSKIKIVNYVLISDEKSLTELMKTPPKTDVICIKLNLLMPNFFYQNCCKYKFCFRLGEVLEIVDDLVIDIPKIWTYIAEILCK